MIRFDRRFRLRTLMIVVAVSALILGGVATYSRRERYRVLAEVQAGNAAAPRLRIEVERAKFLIAESDLDGHDPSNPAARMPRIQSDAIRREAEDKARAQEQDRLSRSFSTRW